MMEHIKIRIHPVARVLLTNGLVRWRCGDCGGLYETEKQATNSYYHRTNANSQYHNCRARPKLKYLRTPVIVGG